MFADCTTFRVGNALDFQEHQHTQDAPKELVMAHAAVLNGLTQKLITAVTGVDTGDRAYKSLRDQTIKGLKDQSHARTNQFAVKAQLDGLAEKFEVLNREDLAQAFQTRLDELPADQRWMPEILSLLLELSDRPVEKTDLADVENANAPPVEESTSILEGIFAREARDEDGLWDDVERGYHSSGDDDLEDDSDPTTSTQATSLAEDDDASIARLHLSTPDESAIADVKATRESWGVEESRRNGYLLSELAIVREILSMMHGLPTDLFHTDDSTGRVSLTRRAKLATTSSHSLYDVLHGCVQTGTTVNSVRRWVVSNQDVACIQSIQAGMQKHLVAFDIAVCRIEQTYVSPDSAAVVSAIGVQTAISGAATALVRLASLVKRSTEAKYISPFVLLDLLYDETIIAQMTDNAELFQSLAAIFLAGLRTYLRHVAAWIKTGSLAARNDGTFFVLDSNKNCEAGNLWHDRFVMRTQPDGEPHMPRCMFALADKMFALGKSRSFLHRLQRQDGESQSVHKLSSATPTFEALLQALREDTFMPFSQLLGHTLESWMSDVSTDCTPQLQQQLLSMCGLSEAVEALPYVYFGRDGIAFASLADSLIKRTGKGRQMTATDQFLLTELAQTTFGNLPGVDPDNVHVTIAKPEATLISESIIRRLEVCTISYNVTWPVQNIIRSSSPVSHSKVFALLLQIHYASSLLQDRFFDMRAEPASGPDTIKLRQRLSCFTSLINDFVTATAHTLHSGMQARMQAAKDIDAMVTVWSDYERRLQTSLMLTSRLEPIKEGIIGVLEISEHLARSMEPKSVAGLLEQFESSMAFLIAGVRGVSRAGGEQALEMLAERLEWSVK
ncbi:unnamed protein product [Zymoseptoria tritici ST99CH_3D7]|uniref:Spindle pole body component n=1 Tax=Zymoseptoria tritici (strain ST99CH_3D7) TaxID=1276538 RepID=A0A1X7S256_ZYMT9|nr:unnamed protein product [Zymoseptoria tritici ST99CH_3D7]